MQQMSRGKKAKARRAKEKYADQDEIDRQLALQVLGSAGAALLSNCSSNNGLLQRWLHAVNACKTGCAANTKPSKLWCHAVQREMCMSARMGLLNERSGA